MGNQLLFPLCTSTAQELWVLASVNQYSSITIMRGFFLCHTSTLWLKAERIKAFVVDLLHLSLSLWEVPAQPLSWAVAARFMDQLLFDDAFIDLCHHQPV